MAPPRSGSSSSMSSVFSDDSYIYSFRAEEDDRFKEMLNEIRMIENNRTIRLERKTQSHVVKRRDPRDTAKRENWTPQMEMEYERYKDKVHILETAKKTSEASTNAAKKCRRSDIATLKKLRNNALIDDKKWLHSALEAGKARLGFMTRYPDAFSTPITISHIKAAEDILNSGRQAMREIDTQEKKIAEVETREKQEAAIAAAQKAKK